MQASHPKHSIFYILLLLSVLAQPLQAQELAQPEDKAAAEASPAPDLETENLASQIHLWAQELSASGNPQLIELKGQSRLFTQNLRLLAENIHWAPEADHLSARGQVELASAEWELKSESLEFRPEQGYLSAQQLELHYKDFVIHASKAQMTGEVWQFEDVHLELAQSPFKLKAARLRILPEQAYENLMLEEVSLAGLELSWPVLTLSLPELNPRRTEVRPPISAFQPELGLVSGGLRIGFNSQLWQDSQQRFYGRLLADPLLGPLAEISHEWRPENSWLLNSQLGIGSKGLQLQSEALWQSPLGPWLRGRARWQQIANFRDEFWLPPQLAVLEPYSGLELWLASEWQDLGPLRFRYLAGGRWPQSQAGASWLGQIPLWQQNQHELLASVLLNGLYDGQFAGTAGGRLLYQYQLSPELELGTYLEQYLSQLSSWSQPQRLSPWLGGFALWQLREDLVLGLESAISLTSGQPVLADALLSWRVRPFYLHLLLQGIPAGVRLQTRFEL